MKMTEEKVELRNQEYDENDEVVFAMTFSVPVQWLKNWLENNNDGRDIPAFLDAYDSDDSGAIYDDALLENVMTDEVVEIDTRDDFDDDDE